MPDDTPAPQGDASIEQIAEQLRDELKAKGAPDAENTPVPEAEDLYILSKESEQVTNDTNDLVDQFNAAIEAKESGKAKTLAEQIRANIKRQYEIINKELPAAEAYYNEAQKEYKPGSPELEEAERVLRGWQDFAAGFESFDEVNQTQMDDVLGKIISEEAMAPEPTPIPSEPEPAPAAPVSAPLKAKPIPPKAAQPVPTAKELSDEEEEQRAAGEGMTAVQPPSIESTPAPVSAPETPVVPPAESGPMSNEELLKAAMDEIENIKRKYIKEREEMIERIKEEMKDKYAKERKANLDKELAADKNSENE